MSPSLSSLGGQEPECRVLAAEDRCPGRSTDGTQPRHLQILTENQLHPIWFALGATSNRQDLGLTSKPPPAPKSSRPPCGSGRTGAPGA